MAAASPAVTEPVMEVTISEKVESSQTTSTAESAKPSWASVVQSKSSLSKHNMTINDIEGTLTVEVPDDIIESLVPLWEDFLISKFLDTAPHVAKVHVIVNKIWTLGDKSVRINAYPVNATTVKFRIKDKATRNRILRRGLWNIADIPMIVSKWTPIVEEAQPEMESIPMWVILKNVPPKMFSEPGLRYIASAVGDPKRLHPDTVQCKSFEEAKVFVEADLTKELPNSFRFKSKLGVDAVVDFKYPWLPPKCLACNKWGPLKDVCLVKKTHGDETIVDSSAAEGNIVLDKPVQPVNQPITMNTEAVETPVDTVEEQEVLEKENIMEADTWKFPKESVSPGKSGGQIGNNVKARSNDIVVSSSCFLLLAAGEAGGEEENEEKNDELEEGEITVKNQTVRKESEKTEEYGTCPSLPRQSKTSHKYLAESGAPSIKAKPSGAMGKKVPLKKH